MPLRDTILPLTSSRTLAYVTLLAMAMGLYSLLPVLKEYSTFKDSGDIPSDMHAALSLILGCLLVFRTNAAYSRWWEARTLWGSLINTSRNLALKLRTLAKPNTQDALWLNSGLAEFPRLLMQHLRLPTQSSDNPGETDSKHEPLALVSQLYDWVSAQKNAKRIDGDELRLIDVELAKLLEICGACERIARTPFVRSYRVFSRQCIVLFLFTFPWGVAQDFQWWTIPLTIIVSYFMIGMEIVAEHVEEPFGLDEDDLDLEGMCKTIDKSIQQVFATTKQES
jgi:putative membrane protein